MVTGKIKPGAYWDNIPGCRQGTLLFLQKEEIFRNYGERTTYVARMREQWSSPDRETARFIWRKTTLEHDPGGLDPPDLVPPQPYEGVTTPCFPVGDG